MSDAGKRRPLPEDVDPVLDLVAEGKSLRASCAEYGIHPGHMHALLDSTDALRAHYARAKEQRAEVKQEEALAIAMAAATGRKLDGQVIKPDGARVLLDAIKWATGRMAPKSGPVDRHELTGKDGGAIPVRFESLSNAQLASFIGRVDAEIGARAGAEDSGSAPSEDDR